MRGGFVRRMAMFFVAGAFLSVAAATFLFWTLASALGSPVGIVRGSDTAEGASRAAAPTTTTGTIRAFAGSNSASRATPAATRTVQSGSMKIR